MGEEKLTLKTEVTGADATAASLEKVKKAQDAVTGGSTKATAATAAVAQGTDAVDKATASQEKLNASESDFVGVLSRLSPALGGFADAMLKGGKIAGDLAGKQIKFGEVLNAVTTAINKNAGALKLLGAAGAVVLGITLITNALAKMREESERLTKSLDDQRDSLNELRGEQRERGQGIEDIAAQRRGGARRTKREPLAIRQTGSASGSVSLMPERSIKPWRSSAMGSRTKTWRGPHG